MGKQRIARVERQAGDPDLGEILRTAGKPGKSSRMLQVERKKLLDIAVLI